MVYAHVNDMYTCAQTYVRVCSSDVEVRGQHHVSSIALHLTVFEKGYLTEARSHKLASLAI